MRRLLSRQGPGMIQALCLAQLGRIRKRRGHAADQYEATFDQAAAATRDDSVLGALFFSHQGRTIFKWTHYFRAYDEELRRLRFGFPLPEGGHRPLRVLELGVFHGGSLQLWRRYFGPTAVIYGIDISPLSKSVDDPDLEVRIGSQADPSFLGKVVAEMGGVDLIIDDGSHIAKHQRASFEILFPLLADGGLYIVEDTLTSYWWDYGGGYRRRSSFLSQTKCLIDDMHGWYHGHRPRSRVDAQHWIPKITVYDSMVVIQKAARERPMVVRFGEDSF